VQLSQHGETQPEQPKNRASSLNERVFSSTTDKKWYPIHMKSYKRLILTLAT
jgi:hypothetical protein